MENNETNLFKEMIKAAVVGIICTVVLTTISLLLKAILPEDIVVWYEGLTGLNSYLSILTVFIIVFMVYRIASDYLLCYTIWIKKSKMNIRYLDYNYKIEFIDHTKAVCTIDATYKSRTPATFYPLKYCWTGTDSYVEPLSDGMVATKEAIQDEQQRWRLDFHCPKKANERIRVNYRIVLYDNKGTAVPTMQYRVDNPISKTLNMELVFDAKIKIKCISKKCYIATSDILVCSDELDSQLRKYQWPIRKPRLLHSYRFDWEYFRNDDWDVLF